MPQNGNRIYLDYAATTPLCAEAGEAMREVLDHVPGNASAVFQTGREARQSLERAREQVADALRAWPDEVYFTSGGTESDNWALKGIAAQYIGQPCHIITSMIEHPAILNTCRFLEKLGVLVTYLQPDRDGRIAPESVRAALRPETRLVSVMWANNEIGTIEPIGEIGRIAREAQVPFHVDAVQAAGTLAIDLREMPVDLLSVSAHKLYGPKGVGALYLRRGIQLQPLIHGGEQERGLRASTENVAGAAGFGAAFERALRDRDEECRRLSALRDLLYRALAEGLPGIRLNGAVSERLPGNLHVTIPGVTDRSLIPLLDLNGVEASAGSACTAGSYIDSHVLQAIGVPGSELHGALRLTLGRYTTESEIPEAARRIIETVRYLRGNQHV